MANAWIIRPLPIAGLSAFATSGGSAANLSNDYMGMVWSALGTAMGGSGTCYHYVDVDLGGDMLVDTVLALGISAPAASASGGGFQIQTNTNAQGTFGTPSYFSAATTLVAGSAPLASGDFTTLWSGTLAAARYFRLTWTSTSRFDLRVRRLVLGQRIALARNFVFGGAFGVRDTGSLDFSARGVLLRRRGVKLRTLGLSFDNIYKDEVETAVQPLIEAVGITEPITLITDPTAHAQRNRRTYFGPLVGDLGTVQRNAVGWQWKASMVSLI